MNLEKNDIRDFVTKLIKPYPMLVGLSNPPSYLSLFDQNNKRILPDLNYVQTDDTLSDLLNNTVKTIKAINLELQKEIIHIPDTEESSQNIRNEENLQMARNFLFNFLVSLVFHQTPKVLKLDKDNDLGSNILNLFRKEDAFFNEIKSKLSNSSIKSLQSSIDFILNNDISAASVPELISTSLIFMDIALETTLTPSNRLAASEKITNYETSVSHPLLDYFKNKYLLRLENGDLSSTIKTPVVKQQFKVISDIYHEFCDTVLVLTYPNIFNKEDFLDEDSQLLVNSSQNTCLSPEYIAFLYSYDTMSDKEKTFSPLQFDSVFAKKEDNSTLDFSLLKVHPTFLNKNDKIPNICNINQISDYDNENYQFVIKLDFVRSTNLNIQGLHKVIDAFPKNNFKYSYLDNSDNIMEGENIKNPSKLIIEPKKEILNIDDENQFTSSLNDFKHFINKTIDSQPSHLSIFSCEKTSQGKIYRLTVDSETFTINDPVKTNILNRVKSFSESDINHITHNNKLK